MKNLRENIEALCITSTSTIRDALSLINREALGFALLLDPVSGLFSGLVTDGDLRRALLNGFGLEHSVQVAANTSPVTVGENVPYEEIVHKFSEKIRIIPIISSSGKVTDVAILDRKLRIPVAEPTMGETELMYVSDCILTGWVSSAGKYVELFEKKFASFCETKHAVSVSNGTAALHLALVALGIGPGDEVIIPSLTFISTANAVRYVGADPVFVDSEKETWNMDPEGVRQALTPRTKAIIPVHIYGHPVDMDPIMRIASEKGIFVIEDAAEAHGALYKGRKVGSIGHMGTFSFYGNKIITTGEGGMIVTNSAEIDEKLRLYRDHGMSKTKRYWHEVLGFNYRLTNIQAALGLAQLEKIEEIIEHKREMASLYRSLLKDIPGLCFSPEMEWAKCVYWMYCLIVDPEVFGMSRNQLADALREKGVDTRPFFPPVHRQPIYNTDQTLPVCEDLSASGINLPSSNSLKSEEVEQICRLIKEISGGN